MRLSVESTMLPSPVSGIGACMAIIIRQAKILITSKYIIRSLLIIEFKVYCLLFFVIKDLIIEHKLPELNEYVYVDDGSIQNCLHYCNDYVWKKSL